MHEIFLVLAPKGRTKHPPPLLRLKSNPVISELTDPWTLWLAAPLGHKGDSEQRNRPSPIVSAVISALHLEMCLPFRK